MIDAVALLLGVKLKQNGGNNIVFPIKASMIKPD